MPVSRAKAQAQPEVGLKGYDQGVLSTLREGLRTLTEWVEYQARIVEYLGEIVSLCGKKKINFLHSMHTADLQYLGER